MESVWTDEKLSECDYVRKKMVASERQAILASQCLTRAVTDSHEHDTAEQAWLAYSKKKSISEEHVSDIGRAMHANHVYYEIFKLVSHPMFYKECQHIRFMIIVL